MCGYFRSGRVAGMGLLIAVMLAFAVSPLLAQGMYPPPPPPPAPSPDKFSGLTFGDFYYFAKDNSATFDKQNGFWFRRIYFTYDHAFSSTVTTRFRLEANSNGKMATPTAAITPYVKDASVKWLYSGRQAISLGIVPTATFDFIETFYGQRHIEKTADDLYKIDSSRDFGVSLAGPLDADNRVQYTVQIGNDSGNNSEVDKYKAFRAAFRYVSNPGLVAEGFYSYHWRALSADRYNVQFFVGYQDPKGRLGFQYTRQTRKPASNTTAADLNINVYSGFGTLVVKPARFSLFARFDKSDVNPDTSGIDYLPIYNKAPFTLGIVGFEVYIHPAVRFSPNVEWVSYGTPANGAAAPARNDAVVRFTWFWTW